MTPDMATVLAIVGGALLLLMTERIRMDVVALLVLGSLAITGLVTPSEALSGFSSPAVVTVWAVFILSGGLTRTGVANSVGRQVLRIAGHGEVRLTLSIMLTAGVMSAFLNNVGVAALLLPVTMDVARQTKKPPSKLLMPLAFGSLMGGLTTLIGTPPNILINEVMVENGLPAFQLFDFAPVGIVVLVTGTLFIALIGRKLLPTRDIAKETGLRTADPEDAYHFQEILFLIRIPSDSTLDGVSLLESRIGAALGLNVLAILRERQTLLAPSADTLLRSQDGLVVEGNLDQLQELKNQRFLIQLEDTLKISALTSEEICFAIAQIPDKSFLIDQTLMECNFRERYGLNVLAIRQNGVITYTDLQSQSLAGGDTLLLHGSHVAVANVLASGDFSHVREVPVEIVQEQFLLQDRLIQLRIPPDSPLVDVALGESRLGDAFGLVVLGILREEQTHLLPGPGMILHPDDILLVEGREEELDTLQALKALEEDRTTDISIEQLTSSEVGMTEVVLSPHTTLAGKTLRELHFREKYGLSVLGIWRGGRPYRLDLRNMELRFGDALLLYGLHAKLRVLGAEPDFLVLTETAQLPMKTEKAPLAVLVMIGVLVSVVFGWLPIAIAAVIGATVMVLIGSLTMEEAYRFIEWKAVFLIAGMLPLGLAMQHTGTARFLAEGVVSLVGGYGPLAIIAGIFLLTAVASQIMPNPAVTVLMAPIALNTATEMGISPFALVMVVAISASSSFLSPVAHPANSLVMGPGGYRFRDFIRVGLPLTLVVLGVVLLVLPQIWPL